MLGNSLWFRNNNFTPEDFISSIVNELMYAIHYINELNTLEDCVWLRATESSKTEV